MAILEESQLKRIMPRCNAGSWAQPLETAMERFDINTPQRAAAFLAQIAHESGEMTRLAENLNYSAERLVKVWPARFASLASAQPYARNPEKLANRVYANRLGNGPETSGDGWRYRGRGVLQLTGRQNYRDTAAALGLPLEDQPELLEQPGPAALSAAHFWKSRGLNALADDRSDDNDDADFQKITKIINGGVNGMAERRAYWAVAKQTFGVG